MTSELDDTIVETGQLLATCPDSVLEEIGQALRDDPDVAMRFGEVLDERAAELGMESGGRTRLRGVCVHIAGRLRRQPPSLLMDECLDKMEREVARHGVDIALWRAVTSEAPTHAIWRESLVENDLLAKSPEEGTPAPAFGAPGATDEATHIRNLSNESPARRVEAARALGELRSEAAVPALAQALESDPDARVRGWYLHALNDIGTPEARRALARGHRDPDERVRALAAELAPTTARPASPPPRPVPDETEPRPVGEHEDFADRQARLRSGTTAVGVVGNVAEGVGAIVLGVGGGIGNPYAMTTGGIFLGLGFLATIATLIMYGVHRRRRREGRVRRRRSRDRE